MGKIVLMMSVSLDGCIEGPDRDLGWHRVDEEVHQHFNDVLREMGAFLDGRVGYEVMAGFWPTADADPNTPAPVAEFAGIWRDKPKYVYSRTLQHADWNTTVVRDVVPEEVRALKGRTDGDLGLGGSDLTAEFLRHDLVDEFRLYVHPVLVGNGKPLFPPGTRPADLRLVESRTFGNGVVLLRYDRANAPTG
ncbi:dihydrofolate reductase family protein [Streptomyces sp. TRM70350]|uniref:dihydrofolate reductase family protein n=1 Tax=Streptomyces sp. TRM70350 TaxID=2856165 RepID=UPI001C48A9D5|nr:dihydrofolate reductase family protein [Streptomyces sp. TRM70350]MBV7700637.1 dihydrofolate reductase family protein [Streptomyces sp. TRM70350]